MLSRYYRDTGLNQEFKQFRSPIGFGESSCKPCCCTQGKENYHQLQTQNFPEIPFYPKIPGNQYKTAYPDITDTVNKKRRLHPNRADLHI